MFTTEKQRKILLLGPSGAGKSTLCNGILSGMVTPEKLRNPAPTGDSFTGVTSEIQHYVGDNTLVITDTIGFDDHRFEPQMIAKELRRLIYIADFGYANIILCLPHGRVSEPSRVYLRMLDAIFEKPETHLILYVSNCEDGTSPEDIVERNKEDRDFKELLRKLQLQQEINGGVKNIITGSMLIHKNYIQDERMYLEMRKSTLLQIMQSISIEKGVKKARPHNELFRNITEFLSWFFGKYRISVKTSAVNMLGELTELLNLRSNVVNIKYNYGQCAICLGNESNIPWVMIVCTHKFHAACVENIQFKEKVTSLRECPVCRNPFDLSKKEILP